MAGGIDWFRWHHGSVTDPKFQLVARKSKQALASVIAVWAFVLEQASASEDRGSFGAIDCEAIDCLLGLEDGATDAILAAMGERGLVDDGAVSAWEKRQPKRERTDNTSTERSRAHRDRQRQEQQDGEKQRHATPEIDDATPCNATQHQKKPRGEERREEKSREEDNPLNPPAGGKARRRCRIPDGFNPSEDGRRRAVQAGLDVDAEIAKFRDHHAAKGSLMADWDAAWRTWVGNAVQFGRAKVQSPSAKPDTPEYAALHKNASWWRDAGFPSVWEAMANKCWHSNAHLFRDGKKAQVAA